VSAAEPQRDQDVLEAISAHGRAIAYVVRHDHRPEATTFVTPPEETLQVGFVVYPAGGEIVRHTHRPVVRSIVGSMEAIVVREGSCEVDVYDDERELVATRTLYEGDVIVFASGGHAFRLLDDTVLLEVKQGPYSGLDEKERF
jgi:quercetin dioxygenase-like cupin family protein